MEPKRSIETTGDTVEEAVSKGLEALGARPNEVIIEVLDEPSRGMFGLGARPARVRLQLMFVRPVAPPPAPEPPKKPQAEKPQPAAAQPPRETHPHDNARRDAPRRDHPRRANPAHTQTTEATAAPITDKKSPAARATPRPQAGNARIQATDEHFYDEEDDDSLPISELGTEADETDLTEEAKIGREVLFTLLQKMGVKAHVAVRRVETTSEGENSPWLLNVTGADLNVLIGRRGETLTALQYITRLIASRKLQHRANIIIDVDNYKSRRSQMLRGLANRMADQAIEQKRTIALEPMPPHERRIIHLTLRERSDVLTKSVGEGEGRKVTIVPK